MRNLLLSYNILFFLIGSIFVDFAHASHDHDHNELHEYYDCHECTSINNIETVEIISDCSINKNSKQFIFLYYSYIYKKSIITNRYLSRAPPAS